MRGRASDRPAFLLRAMTSPAQRSLFAPSLPAGMTYVEEFLSGDEERDLLALIHTLPLQQARYRQYSCRR